MRAADRVARILIRFGGLGTIATVVLVCVFLVWVVVPLFARPSIERSAGVDLDRHGDARAIQLVLDEYGSMVASVFADGSVRVFATGSGVELESRALFTEPAPTCWSFSGREGTFALGFEDGSVRLGRIGFVSQFIDESQLPADVQALEPRKRTVHDGGVIERMSEGQFRLQTLEQALEEPLAIGSGSAVQLVDASESGDAFAALSTDGVLHVARTTRRTNLLTGEETLALTEGRIAVTPIGNGLPPRWLLFAGLGDNVYLAWEDGILQRYDTRNTSAMRLAEEVDLVGEPDARLTSFGSLIGKTSLVAGDDRGRVRVWFRIKPDDATTVDGARLALGHELAGASAPVTSLASSARTRMVAAGYADGTARLFHATSEKLIAATTRESGSIEVLSIAPKDDALLLAFMPPAPAESSGKIGFALWSFDALHPETSVASVWRPVWYEGAEKPEHVWQSSSGTDDFEPKYGLWPLVFGTLKATFYSLLFGVPIALLAAVYTSEFMHPRTKAKVKPTIETMASLPSVVLGFLAALIVAPAIEDYVAEALVALAAIPFAFLLGAHLWQLLPSDRSVRWARWRIVAVALAVPAGLLLSFVAAGPIERAFFGGDIRGWLDGREGSGTGGWMFLFLPLSALAVATTLSARFDGWIRARSTGWSRARAAAIDLVFFLVSSALALGLALLLSWAVSGLGFDPRGAFLDTYVQRNALVVGFIMGFAVIPIIYTISEDALSAVPEYLRAGSLAAGATAWQTAFRVIIPTAMSGLFSAVMIGFGRAVGETMIVLMAAGNTPILDWNPFNGFRTLSANIAVELPEAVQGSTHYRMLFLAALTLFAITFAVNTLAEIVRQRFRKRAFQL